MTEGEVKEKKEEEDVKAHKNAHMTLTCEQCFICFSDFYCLLNVPDIVCSTVIPLPVPLIEPERERLVSFILVITSS